MGAELGILGIIVLGIWATISGIIDSIRYSNYQNSQNKKGGNER